MSVIKKAFGYIVNRGPIGWFRRLFLVVRSYHHDVSTIAQHVDYLKNTTDTIESYVKRATKVHVDVACAANAPSIVVVIGTYRGKDYVRLFPQQHDNVESIVNWLTGLSKQAKLGRLEMAPVIDATVRRKLKDKGVEL